MALALSLAFIACSTPALNEANPEERVRQARIDLQKRRYEKAYDSLEEARFVTAGTRLGGEVQFLLGQAAFKAGKYPEAESHFSTYLNSYPDGPFVEQALFTQAQAKVKQLLKRNILTFKTYIPHDRDITLLREARVLFEIYIERYPAGEWIGTATSRAEELLIKEGRHELEIAAFYLRKKRPRSALERARAVLEGNYPDDIKADALDLTRKAEESSPEPEGEKDL
jgi:outer membrane protein assembly factor BamD